jgi:acyl-CoA synthetase (NDP forming)
MRDLSRLFQPKSIAVFGGWWAENVVTQCQKSGFEGDIWPVHPTRDEIGGVPCFRTIADLPAAPDAAFLGINRHAVIEVTAALAARGCGGAVCFASGFAETGDAALQAALIAAAGEMPLLGPNCYGVLNYLDGAMLWPDQHGGRPVDSGVALISQSSNIVINMSMQARGLPIAYIACVGNQAQTSLTEMAATLLADDRVTAAGLYIEGIVNTTDFAAMAAATRRAGKHLVAIKSGKTAASQDTASSHTAALAGDAAASSAFLAQCGVIEVDTPEEMLETLKLLHLFGRLAGNRISAMCCSGGETGMMADLSASMALDWPAIPHANQAALAETLGPLVTISNPLDYHTFIWGDEERMTRTFASMMGSFVDASILVIDFPRADRCSDAAWHPAVAAMRRAGKMTDTPMIMLGSIAEGISDEWATRLMEDGIVPLCGFATGLCAIEKVTTDSRARTDWQPLAVARSTDVTGTGQRGTGQRRMLDESRAKDRLAGWGVACPRGARAETPTELAPASAALRAPFALKGLGHPHKSEAGLVKLNLTADALVAAAGAMETAAGFLVEEMVPPAVGELLVGLRRDPVYGTSLTIGTGGIAAELLGDTQTLILPVEPRDVLAAINRLQLAPLFSGYRGTPQGDLDAAVAAIMAMAAAMQNDAALDEIEVNPLMVAGQGKGAIAADAVIWMNDNQGD